MRTNFVRTGRGRGRLNAGGKVKVVVKLTRKAKRGLRHARRVKARLRTTATGTAGKAAVTNKVTLRR